jgi:uncharacterized spore protein YtfJ
MTPQTAIGPGIEPGKCEPGESVGADSLVTRLAEMLGSRASAATVYAAPIEREGVTVIPVATIRYGFGGGGGRQQEGSGGGGGGGVIASPVGYIEIKNGSARFRPIIGPGAVVSVVLAVSTAGWLLVRGRHRRSTAKV